MVKVAGAPVVANGEDGLSCAECEQPLVFEDNEWEGGSWTLNAMCECGPRTLRVQPPSSNGAGVDR